jgi:very-short-patch-repair endonuclease
VKIAEPETWLGLHFGNRFTKKMFQGLDFDRQKVIGNYNADNYEHEDL